MAPAATAAASPPAGGSECSTPYMAQQFCPAEDIVAADLVLVMDKYTAADVLREVSVLQVVAAAHVKHQGRLWAGAGSQAWTEGGGRRTAAALPCCGCQHMV